jgi:hypothetical protein
MAEMAARSLTEECGGEPQFRLISAAASMIQRSQNKTEDPQIFRRWHSIAPDSCRFGQTCEGARLLLNGMCSASAPEPVYKPPLQHQAPLPLNASSLNAGGASSHR